MDDRFSVTLAVPDWARETVEQIRRQVDCSGYFYGVSPGLVYYIFEDVNYDDLEILEQLRLAGIPYESRWETGTDYCSGAEYVRFTETGELIRKEIFDIDLNPDLNELLARLEDPQALVDYIRQHAAKLQVLPWDNQQEYGKRYRARQLLTPSS